MCNKKVNIYLTETLANFLLMSKIYIYWFSCHKESNRVMDKSNLINPVFVTFLTDNFLKILRVSQV